MGDPSSEGKRSTPFSIKIITHLPNMTNICSSFIKNSDGSWTTLCPVSIEAQNGRIDLGAGLRFTPGVLFSGVDLAAWLESNCR